MDAHELIFSVNRALWGKVYPSLRAVWVQSQSTDIVIAVYLDPEPSKMVLEEISVLETEVMADFPSFRVRTVVRCNGNERKAPDSSDWLLVFLRAPALAPVNSKRG